MKNFTFLALRNKYPDFYFTDFSFSWTNKKTLQLKYSYAIPPDWEFNPEVRITFGDNLSMQDIHLEVFVKAIGMIELISYWKATCSPNVYLAPLKLLPEEIDFWLTVFYYGLGEFFYKNNITTSQEDFLNFKVSTLKKKHIFEYPFEDNKIIVPIGGGKDSIVTLSILKKHGYEVIPFVVNPSETTKNILRLAGYSEKDSVFVHREIDHRLYIMNERGYLNGHIPFSAVLAFYSIMIAAMVKARHIALSNESSANESTIPGTLINHQYSKTFHFEKIFRTYVHNHMSPTSNYFSFLRPLNELQIAALFSQMPEFHAVFRSCNAGSKKGIWCNECPKCLFTHIILSPFLEPSYIRNNIGLHTFDNENLSQELLQLIGQTEEKPFECVGTMDEVKTALAFILQYRFDGKQLPVLLDKVARFISFEKSQDINHFLKQFNPEHFLEKPFENILRHELEQLSIY
ncbi:MAG: hypothetical protein N2Z72_06825 [Bacteroidales bacterium]|nr:hypothetical protein [Bacteroidales bacterium]